MFGQATLYLPTTSTIGPSKYSGLSDAMAMSFGRTAARTLSEEDGFVLVTLENGSEIVIGHDTLNGVLTIGRLVHSYS